LTGNSYEPPRSIKSTVEKMRRLGSIKTTGVISHAGRRLIESRFNAWYHTLTYHNTLVSEEHISYLKKFVLITLTLPVPQLHDDYELKRRALKPFLKYLEREHGMLNWAWKAETQNNGNIHFHVVTDTYIPKEVIDNQWRHYMSVLGYMEKFWEKFPGKNPPMTNVTGQSKMKNPVAYMTKYFEKKENKRKIKGAIWRMSQNLIHLENFSIEVSSDEIDKWLTDDLENVKRVYDEDYFIMFIMKKPTTVSELMPQYSSWEKIHWLIQVQALENRNKKKWSAKDKKRATKLMPPDLQDDSLIEDPKFYQLLIPGFDALDPSRFRER